MNGRNIDDHGRRDRLNFLGRRLDQRAGGANPFVVSGLAGQIREHTLQVGAGIANPPGLRIKLEQMLRNYQAKQLGIREYGLPAPNMSPRQADLGQDLIVQEDVKCGQEGVEFIVHTKGLTPSAND